MVNAKKSLIVTKLPTTIIGQKNETLLYVQLHFFSVL